MHAMTVAVDLAKTVFELAEANDRWRHVVWLNSNGRPRRPTPALLTAARDARP